MNKYKVGLQLLFNSNEFIFIFLPITLLVYFILARYKLIKLATLSLVVASLAFYSYWDIRYLPLLLGSILFNYTVGHVIEKTRSKKILIMGIAINLLLLGYFKYTGFVLRFINDALCTSLFVPNIILPLGISFFTFTQTAYLVDAYRGETKKYKLLTYSAFVTVFPHLIAGPILYHKDMIPQFSKIKNFVFSYKNMALGITVFSIGLFKKVVIADTLAPWVKVIFENADKVTFMEAWAGALGYTLQLYFDFSGYSEMAVGLGLMFNFKLPNNFNVPYRATSIIDFWRRWHMSLSAFLKDYLYIPLGGNRQGPFYKYRNLMITMLLGGLWHGAGWTFVIWGGLHGMYLVVNHLWRQSGFTMPKVVAWLFTITSVVFAWVVFRANSVTDAYSIWEAMLGLKGMVLPAQWAAFIHTSGQYFANLKYLSMKGINQVLLFMGLALCENYLQKNTRLFRPSLRWFCFVIVILSWSIFYLGHVSEFLYFQF